MTRGTTDRLNDIILAIDRIAELRSRTSGHPTALHDAVAYNLMLIGEAVRHLPAELLNAEDSVPWGGAIALRNVLAHRYFDVEPQRVWRICDENLPTMRRAVERLLCETATS